MSEKVPLVKALESKRILSLQLLDRIGTAPPVSDPIAFDQSGDLRPSQKRKGVKAVKNFLYSNRENQFLSFNKRLHTS